MDARAGRAVAAAAARRRPDEREVTDDEKDGGDAEGGRWCGEAVRLRKGMREDGDDGGEGDTRDVLVGRAGCTVAAATAAAAAASRSARTRSMYCCTTGSTTGSRSSTEG